MKHLKEKIAKQLETKAYCAVDMSEMLRVWPNKKTREEDMGIFAQSHGWRLYYHKPGFVAIFDKAPPSERN